MKYELSILIPARNEMFLARTVQDLLENIEANTEILVGLDGAWADPPIPLNDRVTVLYYPESVGQRAMTNHLAKLSNAKYVMKVDAHCAFDKGFDRKMLNVIQEDWTLVPEMRNLHVFDWVCDKCGDRRYQGRTPTSCPKCDNTSSFHRDIVWKAKSSPKSHFYRFDNTLHFQYWKDYEKRENAWNGDLGETMSIQGSCFMLSRDKYWELDICDERHGSWGQQGVEVACKTWLSGGKLMTYKGTWYAHLFRTQGGDFGFPYPNPGISKARQYSRELWFDNKWSKAKYNLDWLLDKFSPVPDWDMSVGVLYYSTGDIDKNILEQVQEQLKRAVPKNNRIVSCTLIPMDFGDNIHLPLQKGYLTMAKQILTGLKELDTDVVFFVEHDVLYHPSHFDFRPSSKDIYYYNTNVWRVRYSDGHAIRTDDTKQLSGLCAHRDLLIKHFEKRVELLQNKLDSGATEEEFNRYVRRMGFEPGTHGREERVDNYKADSWESRRPNVDIRDHGTNVTPSKWSPDQYRNKKYAEGWKETDDIPGWGRFTDFFSK